MNQPHLWWYVTRASALIAWVLLTGSVVLGIFLSTRVMRKIDNPAWLQDLHRFMSALALIMVGVHMVSLMLDEFVHFDLVELLVPGGTANTSVTSIQSKTIGISMGIIALYLLVAVQSTSWFMNRLPRRLWKGIHYSSYVALILVTFHAAFSGSDVKELWYKTMAILLIGVAAGATIIRAVVGTRTRPARVSAGRGAVAANEARPAGRSGAPLAATSEVIRMRVADVGSPAKGIKSFRLYPVSGGTLPVWQPGAHITLYLPDGRERQYSLCGDPAERDHFDIAVLKKSGPQSGSSWIHSQLKPGAEISVSAPRNHFELEPAKSYVFVAGGIGITPIKSMIESLPPRRVWQLYYFGRSRTTMAFADELAADFPESVHIFPGDERQSAVDVRTIVREPDAEVYCCGPESLMSAVAECVPAQRLHLERFVAVTREHAEPQSVVLNLKKTGKRIEVPANESLLDALEKAGAPVTGSCRQGLCGTCEVRVLQGEPEHLDSIMDDEEKNELHIMYPCVSRAKTPELTLNV